MTYEPGTVAVATVRGKEDVRVMFSTQYTDAPWVSAEPVGAWGVWHGDVVDVTDVRPLVVLDPDTIDTPAEIREHLERVKHISEPGWLVRFADQIEAQTKPPRIPEPGKYGVVEASTEAVEGRRMFCRLEDDAEGWSGAGSWFKWGELIDPVLIRDGVEES